MEQHWKWAVGLVVTVSIPLGGTFVGNGFSQDPHGRGLILAGIWIIAGGIMLLLVPTVIWPFVRFMLGPVHGRMTALGDDRPRGALVISRAEYGLLDTPGFGPVDVTGTVQRKVRNGRLVIPVVNGDAFQVADPAPGKTKTLVVHYSVGRRNLMSATKDGDRLILPLPSG